MKVDRDIRTKSTTVEDRDRGYESSRVCDRTKYHESTNVVEYFAGIMPTENHSVKERTTMAANKKVVYEDDGASKLWDAMIAIGKDTLAACRTLTPHQVRFLVDNYYAWQKQRQRTDNQVFALTKEPKPKPEGWKAEPCEAIKWLRKNAYFLERQMELALKQYAYNDPLCKWPLAQFGIGHIVSAGLRAHIDFSKVETAGDIWRFAGLDPTSEWIGRASAKELLKELYTNNTDATDAQILILAAARVHIDPEKVEEQVEKYGKLNSENLELALSRCPWNARFKRLCFIIGDLFRKFSKSEKCFYGRKYLERKAYETAKNANGDYKDQAAAILKSCPGHKQRSIYKAGKLPDGQIDMRARRWATKLFLAHYMEESFKVLGKPVPLPYPIARQGHTHVIPPPAGTEKRDADTCAAS